MFSWDWVAKEVPVPAHTCGFRCVINHWRADGDIIGWGAFTVTASYTACPKASVDGVSSVLHYSFWLCGVVARTWLWRTWIPCTFRRHSTCKECVLTGLTLSWLKHIQKNKVRNFVSVKCFSPYPKDYAVSSSMGLLVCCLQVDGLSDEEIQARFASHTESLPWQGENGLKTSTSLCHLHHIWNPSLSSMLPQFCTCDTVQRITFLTVCSACAVKSLNTHKPIFRHGVVCDMIHYIK
jgi:hypothetical protein